MSSNAPSKSSIIVPVILITIGVGWLLTAMGVAPEFEWGWTLGLAVTGYLLFATLGVDKFTVVCGPLLFAASFLSIFTQNDSLSLGMAIPILVILTGVLLLVARKPSIPSPKWIEVTGDKIPEKKDD